MKDLIKKQKGFTIIEVLIVLAIAGLIMLIVFLAVPTLQRNSRNQQRANDASLIAASVSECMNNRNGQVASCDTLAEVQNAGGLDTGKIRQLTTITVGATAPSAPTGTPVPVDAINVGFVAKCGTDGSSVVAGSARQAALIYNVEGSSGAGATARCIEV